MTKEGCIYNPSCEFSNRTDSNCIYTMVSQFSEFWPKEVAHFQTLINQHPIIDLACGSYENCTDSLRALSKFMGYSTIKSYIGVDLFNIDENSKDKLVEELSRVEVAPIDEITSRPKLTPILELQPNLSQNIFLHNSDMVEYLKTLPDESVKILSIGGFASPICDPKSLYRTYLISEIQRVLALDSYFLSAGSSLNIKTALVKPKIIEIKKDKDLNWSNSHTTRVFLNYFKLYQKVSL